VVEKATAALAEGKRKCKNPIEKARKKIANNKLRLPRAARK